MNRAAGASSLPWKRKRWAGRAQLDGPDQRAGTIDDLSRIVGHSVPRFRPRPDGCARPAAGASGRRSRTPTLSLWTARSLCILLRELELQKLADELEFPITVCRATPCQEVEQVRAPAAYFRSSPSTGEASCCSYRTIVQLIAATTTNTGVRCAPS